MENAVKALYIAAGVLMAVMILSLAVVLYSSLQGYVEDSNKQVKYNEVNSFNSKYLNYINNTNGEKQFVLTIQNVITAASNAYENNRLHSVSTSEWNVSPNALYVQVNLNGNRIDTVIDEQMVSLLEENKDKQYMCTSDDVLISEITGQVYSITFSETN